MFYVECQKCVAILMITMYFFFPLTEAKRTDPSEGVNSNTYVRS